MAKKKTEAKTLDTYRQGDVLVERIGSIPSGAKKKPRDGRIVLAYGEVTGHAHAILEETAIEYELDGTVYIHADGEIELRHEEHGTVALPKGDYRVRRQREYSPEAIRNVAD